MYGANAGKPELHRHDNCSNFSRFDWLPPPEEEPCDEELAAHVSAHLGPIDRVYREMIGNTVLINILVIRPTAAFPFVRLVTSGMSARAMSVPENCASAPFLELMVNLPADWKLDELSQLNEKWYWPVRMLRDVARLPHVQRSWLACGDYISNRDPPAPYIEGIPFCGTVLLPPVSAPEEFGMLVIPGDREIEFLAAVPLFPGEIRLVARRGVQALIDRFDRKGVRDIISFDRPDVSKKRFWFF